eukprot:3931822-Rhodomonas_salina.1
MVLRNRLVLTSGYGATEPMGTDERVWCYQEDIKGRIEAEETQVAWPMVLRLCSAVSGTGIGTCSTKTGTCGTDIGAWYGRMRASLHHQEPRSAPLCPMRCPVLT